MHSALITGTKASQHINTSTMSLKRSYDEVEADHVDDVLAEDSEDRVAPHDATKERQPSCPYVSQKREDLIGGIVAMLEAPLKKSAYPDATTDVLSAEIKQRATSNFPEEVRIALVGDMKSGMY